MPDRITLDDALAQPKSAATGRITIDEALATYESTKEPRLVNNATAQVGGGYAVMPAPDAIGPPEESNFGANVKSRLVNDPETQRRILANSLFPKDPKGIDRVGFADGVPVYVDDKGKLRRVSGKFADFLASATANLPETIGGTVGSFAGSPVLGGALGAVGARGIKRAAAGLAFGEPQTISGNMGDLATEAAVNVGAGVLGKGLVKVSDRGKISDFTPTNLKQAEQTRNTIKQVTGVDLDLALASGDRKLIALRNYVARSPHNSAQAIQAADEAMQGQFDSATRRLLAAVASPQPGELVGREGINAAQAAIYTARQGVSAKVKPLYDAAYAAVPEVTDPNILKMLELPHFKEALRQGHKIAKLEGVELTSTPSSAHDVYRGSKAQTAYSLRALDYVKRGLDDKIEALMDGGKRQEARALKLRRNEFVASLDALPNQEWQLARQKYGELIDQQVAPLENGPIGVLAQIKDNRAATAAAKIFSDPNVTPEQIAMTKAVLGTSNPEAYRGLVRHWLGQQYNQALKETQTAGVVNPAGKFRQAVFGTPDAKLKAKAMLPGDAYKTFEDLMLAAEKLSAAPLRGSDTAFNQQITEQLKGKAMAAIQWIVTPRQAMRSTAEARALETGMEDLTEALLNPVKRHQLKTIVRMAPSTRQAILIGSLLGGQAMKSALAEVGDGQTPPFPSPVVQ